MVVKQNRDKSSELAYDEYRVKVPKQDKEGKDITGDKLGKGGRHRDDGTFSAMAYDFQPLEDDGPSREELEYQLELLAHEERLAEIQSKQSTADTITATLESINNILEFVSEHPEILEAAYKLRVKAKNGVIIIKNKIVAAVRGEKGKQKSKSTVLKSDSKQKSASTILSVATSNEVIAENTDTSKIEGENLSIEEARELVLSILLDYVSMKKKLNRLSNANIKNGKRMELNVEEVVAQLDTLVNRYPALMDDNTTESISALLKMNINSQENKRIKETLRIDGLLKKEAEDNG